MFWIALAAQISMPLPDKGGLLNIFTHRDVPMSLVAEGEWRSVGVRVTVTPEAKILQCETEATSGIAKLDAYTCAIIIKRAKLHPAIWSDGSATYGIIRTAVIYSVNYSNPPPAPGDIELTVNQLPKGIKSPANAYVMFAVDEAGRPSHCAEEDRVWRPLAGKAPQLIAIACEQVAKSWHAKPAQDASGRPVQSIQNALVKFTADRR
jgi:hypothetical protein